MALKGLPRAVVVLRGAAGCGCALRALAPRAPAAGRDGSLQAQAPAARRTRLATAPTRRCGVGRWVARPRHTARTCLASRPGALCLLVRLMSRLTTPCATARAPGSRLFQRLPAGLPARLLLRPTSMEGAIARVDTVAQLARLLADTAWEETRRVGAAGELPPGGLAAMPFEQRRRRLRAAWLAWWAWKIAHTTTQATAGLLAAEEAILAGVPFPPGAIPRHGLAPSPEPRRPRARTRSRSPPRAPETGGAASSSAGAPSAPARRRPGSSPPAPPAPSVHAPALAETADPVEVPDSPSPDGAGGLPQAGPGQGPP